MYVLGERHAQTLRLATIIMTGANNRQEVKTRNIEIVMVTEIKRRREEEGEREREGERVKKRYKEKKQPTKKR